MTPDIYIHRFLWRNFANRAPDIYAKRVIWKCLISCISQAMDATSEKFADKYPEASETIFESRYMDDLADLLHDQETAEERMQQIDEFLAEGDFKIKKWITNQLIVESAVIERVLGVNWNPGNDKISVSVNLPQNYNPNVNSQSNLCLMSYLALDGEQNNDVRFLMAESRVALLRQLRVARLELQSALLASRLAFITLLGCVRWSPI